MRVLIRLAFWTTAAALIAVPAAAQGSKSSTDSSAAVHVVERFLRAETMGASDSAWKLLHDCTVAPTTDYLEPTIKQRIISVRRKADTSVVTVRYVVLGRASSEDPATAKNPDRYWHFQPGVRTETIHYPVVTVGSEAMIDCGSFPPNHAAARRIAAQRSHMDEQSQHDWDSAWTQGQRLADTLPKHRP